MAPLKPASKQMSVPLGGIKTRAHFGQREALPKRKAEESPLKRLTVKRSALNELTNSVNKHGKQPDSIKGVTKGRSSQNVTLVARKKPTVPIKPLQSNNENIQFPPTISQKAKTLVKPNDSKPTIKLAEITNKPVAKPLGDKSITKPTDAKSIAKPAEVKSVPKPVEKSKLPVVKTSSVVKSDPPANISESVKIITKAVSSIIEPLNKVSKAVEAPAIPSKPGVVTRSSLTRKSLTLETSSNSSLYISALEDLNLLDDEKALKTKRTAKVQLPEGVEDVDKKVIDDLFSVGEYAMDVFNYLKEKEKSFIVKDYIPCQRDINQHMRALLVDWLVEVQENFEVNHESLYLGIKLVDLYLSKIKISKERLQLIGATAFLIACKYDETVPPLLSEIVYVCDNLYTADEVVSMEIDILKAVNFQLGVPLSYSFLRRYARCANFEMPTLTLARYILEYNLMNYAVSRFSDSKKAAASLYMAISMQKIEGGWSRVLQHYSGYKIDDFKTIAIAMNTFLHKNVPSLQTVRNKYSHEIFYKVSLTPLIHDLKL